METNKLSEIIDIGLEMVRNGRMFGLISPREARKMAVISFVGGALLGGGVVASLFLRGRSDLAEAVRTRVDEIRQTVMNKMNELKGEIKGKGDSEKQAEPRVS